MLLLCECLDVKPFIASVLHLLLLETRQHLAGSFLSATVLMYGFVCWNVGAQEHEVHCTMLVVRVLGEV
eukprot:scaffold31885_cov18-Tisochrysis_lutea.AAC.1